MLAIMRVVFGWFGWWCWSWRGIVQCDGSNACERGNIAICWDQYRRDDTTLFSSYGDLDHRLNRCFGGLLPMRPEVWMIFGKVEVEVEGSSFLVSGFKMVQLPRSRAQMVSLRSAVNATGCGFGFADG